MQLAVPLVLASAISVRSPQSNCNTQHIERLPFRIVRLPDSHTRALRFAIQSGMSDSGCTRKGESID